MNSQSGNAPVTTGAASTDGMYDGVGHSLKVVRERRGLTLADVSARLRIRRPYLEAIEGGRFGELPGAVYVTGFLRQYAEFLDLDPEQVLRTYQTEAEGKVQRTVLNFPLPRPEDRRPRLWLVVGALVLAVAVYAMWYRHQESLRIGHELIQAVPSRLADLVPSPQPIAPAVLPPAATVAAAPVQPAAPPPAPAAAPALAPAPPAAPPHAPAQGSVGAPVTASAPPSVAPPPVVPAPGPAISPAAPVATAETTYGASAAASRIRVEATAPAWIQVRGPNNEQVFTRLLSAGERYQVPDRAGLTLLTGNAGGVRIIVDGQALAPLGGEGEVRRGIQLDPERLKNPATEREG